MTGGSASILVVDDDAAIRKILGDRFRALGHDVLLAAGGAEALLAVERNEPDLLLLDLQMPDVDGFAVLEALRKLPQPPAVIVLTAHGSVEAAVRAVRAGAEDLITKPFDAGHLEHVVATVLERGGMRRRIANLESELSSRHALVRGASSALRDAHATAMRAAASDATILLRGESGTGKEVFARAIHAASKRRDGPFLAVNCAVLGSDLLETELFGHEKGAFTGAVRGKPGKLELAAKGTLFLDEIGELSPALQPKLLRALQEREFERVGGARTLHADVRVVAATNRDLSAEIAHGRFRQDLYYRLNVVSIRLPPLRERPEDVPDLLDHFLRRFACEAGRQDLRFSPAARDALLRYGWPGNVRELANVVERAVVLAVDSALGVDDLPEEIVENGPHAGTEPGTPDAASYHQAVIEAKRSILRDALRRTGGHQTRAAESLGMGQPYLARLMKNLGVRD